MPVHLLLAFLVAAAHRHGYLTWFKEEWVTYRFWKRQIRRYMEGLTRGTAGGREGEGQGEGERSGCSGAGCSGGGESVPDKKTR